MTKDQPRLLIKNGTLIDGSGQDPVANMVIVVEGSPSDDAGYCATPATSSSARPASSASAASI